MALMCETCKCTIGLDDKCLNCNEETKAPFTVGELKKYLQNLTDETQITDDTQIVVAVGDYFQNIGEIILPDNDDYFAVTFELTDNFDPRQF
jgi:hypothetical protein